MLVTAREQVIARARQGAPTLRYPHTNLSATAVLAIITVSAPPDLHVKGTRGRVGRERRETWAASGANEAERAPPPPPPPRRPPLDLRRPEPGADLRSSRPPSAPASY